MLFVIILTTFLATTEVVFTDNLKTTSPVSIVFDGFSLKTWNDRSLWNQTRLAIVQHLNEFCKKDQRCDADYGIGNIHLLNIIQTGSSSVRLNITADKPLLLLNTSASYNYTALLTGALFQTKIDIERWYDNHSLYSSTYSNENSMVSRTSRLLFVFLGIILVGLIFGLTVVFFQRIRRHSYSKLLKTPRICQPGQDEPLTNSPSPSVLHQ